MKLFILLLLSLSSISTFAAVKTFRSGDILAAGITSTRPDIKNWNKHLFEPHPNTSYAAVAVRIHPKRKISIYDYSLALHGRNYPCVAIRTNDGKFEYTQKAFSSDKQQIYTLLFFLTDTAAADIQASLISNSPPNAVSSALFDITYDGDELCPFNMIKKDGNFK